MQGLWLEEYRQSDTHGILCYELALQMKLPKKFNVWTCGVVHGQSPRPKRDLNIRGEAAKRKGFCLFFPVQVQSGAIDDAGTYDMLVWIFSISARFMNCSSARIRVN